MSILKLANTFNLLAQQSQLNGELQGYHFGTAPDINRNVENNLNPNNEYGNKFPYLLALYPEFVWNAQQPPQTNYQTTLYFYDTQWRENDGTPDPRDTTDALKLNLLEKIARNFITNLYNVGLSGVLGFKFGFTEVQGRTAEMQENDRLICVQVGLNIVMNYTNCPTWSFNMEAIDPSYELADLDTIDFETVL